MWPAWHNLTSTVVLRGRRGTYGTGWRAWTWLGARDAAAFCVAGVAQPHIYRHFTWQGVAQPHIYRRFAWQACHLWHWVARLDLVRRPWRRGILRGRRGTTSHLPSFHVAGVAQPHIYRHLPSFHVAGVAQPHIYRRFAWHFAWQAWHNLTSTVISRGRRGTTSHLPSFCVAGVALMALGGALGLG